MKEYLMDNKKVAIIVGRDPSMKNDTDGGSVYLEYLAQTVEKFGANIDVYIPSGIKGGIYYTKRDKEQQLQDHKHKKVWDSHRVNVIYFPIAKIDDTLNTIQKPEDYFLTRLDKSKKISHFFKDKKLFKYDIVYILHMGNAFGIVKNGLTPLKKTILFPMMTTAHYKKFTKVPIEYTKAEYEVMQKMRHICSPSDDEINNIIKLFNIPKTKLFKIHRGFSPDDFPIQEHSVGQTNVINIFSANGIRPQKDHMFFIPFMLELKKLGIEPHLHLTGNNGNSHNPKYNEYTQKFWESVRLNNLQNYVTAYGVVNRDKLINIMSICDFAMYPSISETFGKSALESIVSGLPTLVLDDIPAFTEFITNGKTGIITPRDAIKSADITANIFKDPTIYNKISKNGIAIRDKFTWNYVMHNLMQEQINRKILL